MSHPWPRSRPRSGHCSAPTIQPGRRSRVDPTSSRSHDRLAPATDRRDSNTARSGGLRLNLSAAACRRRAWRRARSSDGSPWNGRTPTCTEPHAGLTRVRMEAWRSSHVDRSRPPRRPEDTAIKLLDGETFSWKVQGHVRRRLHQRWSAGPRTERSTRATPSVLASARSSSCRIAFE